MEDLEEIKETVDILKQNHKVTDLFAKKVNYTNIISSFRVNISKKESERSALKKTISLNNEEIKKCQQLIKQCQKSLHKHKNLFNVNVLSFRLKTSMTIKEIMNEKKIKNILSIMDDLEKKRKKLIQNISELKGMISNDSLSIDIIEEEIRHLEIEKNKTKSNLDSVQSLISFFEKEKSKVTNIIKFVDSQLIDTKGRIHQFRVTYAHISYRIKRGKSVIKLRDYIRIVDTVSKTVKWFKTREGKTFAGVSEEKATALEQIFTIAK
jgi:chromosome segregation ATPase